MNIVLVEFFNGDTTEAEAFKDVESFKDYYVNDLFVDDQSRVDKFNTQLDEQLSNGHDIVDIDIDYYTIKAYTKYGI